MDGWQYALTGRTGGRNANQFIDNLTLNADVIAEPSGVLFLGLAGLMGFARRRRA